MLTRRSFHDPDGFVAESEGTILRWVAPAMQARVTEILRAPWTAALVRDGMLIDSSVVPDPVGTNTDASGGTWLSHPRIPFPSYPHEWVPEMLAAAAHLTLDVNDRAIGENHILKDASARNILFCGTRPVFVDLLSIQPRTAGNPVWRARGQFERHFVLPLLAYRHLGTAPSLTHAAYEDGMPHDALFRALGAAKWVNPGLLAFVTLPALLGRGRRSSAAGSASMSTEVAESTLRFGMRQLRRSTEASAARVPAPDSAWSDYESNAAHYPGDSLQKKRDVVARWLGDIKAKTALDIGSNTGTYARLAAISGASVVAVESDVDACRKVFAAAQAEALDILPLAMSISSPSPARGWNGLETKGFDERAAGHFDAVIALAVLHHLMASEGIPLAEIFSKLASYTRRHLVVEFVAGADPKFRELQRHRERDFAAFDEAAFTDQLARRFRILAREEIVPGFRSVYLCEKC